MYEEQKNGYDEVRDIEIEDADITFLNFQGKEGDYNREGDRNFCIVIPNQNDAVLMYNDGWNIAVRAKEKAHRDACKGNKTLLEKIEILNSLGVLEDAMFYLKINVSYKYPEKAPKIWLVKNRSDKKRLEPMSELTVGELDNVDILRFDCVINAHHYSTPTRSGISAYLKEAYVTIRESAIKQKYAEYED